MYGRGLNKRVRHNLCFADNAQESDVSNGIGTTVSFDDTP